MPRRECRAQARSWLRAKAAAATRLGVSVLVRMCGDVDLHGALAEEEGVGDLLVGAARDDQAQHLQLPRREPGGVGGGRTRGGEAGDQRVGARRSRERRRAGRSRARAWASGGPASSGAALGGAQLGEGQQGQGALVGQGAGVGEGQRRGEVRGGVGAPAEVGGELAQEAVGGEQGERLAGGAGTGDGRGGVGVGALGLAVDQVVARPEQPLLRLPAHRPAPGQPAVGGVQPRARGGRSPASSASAAASCCMERAKRIG